MSPSSVAMRFAWNGSTIITLCFMFSTMLSLLLGSTLGVTHLKSRMNCIGLKFTESSCAKNASPSVIVIFTFFSIGSPSVSIFCCLMLIISSPYLLSVAHESASLADVFQHLYYLLMQFSVAYHYILRQWSDIDRRAVQ